MSETERTLLCVDDEPNILNALKRLLRGEGYRLLIATSGQDALDILKNNEVQLIITDQRMPQMNGTDLLASVKEAYPHILRIILTGYTDVDSITESINKGHVYKFFLKPWNDQNLKLEIRQAFEQCELIRANELLDKTVMEQNQQLRHVNENLEKLVEERTQEIALQNQALSLSHDILEHAPLSIIGVDADGTIVLANRKARALTDSQAISIGNHIGEYFPAMVGQALREVFDGNEARTMEVHIDAHQTNRVSMTPLCGGGDRKGVILTFFTS